jgi:hypothetical protein
MFSRVSVLIDGCRRGLDLELLPRDCHVTAIDSRRKIAEPAPKPRHDDRRVMDAAALDSRRVARLRRAASHPAVVLDCAIAREAARAASWGRRFSRLRITVGVPPRVERRRPRGDGHHAAADDILVGTELRVVREPSVFGVFSRDGVALNFRAVAAPGRPPPPHP